MTFQIDVFKDVVQQTATAEVKPLVLSVRFMVADHAAFIYDEECRTIKRARLRISEQ